MARFPCSRCHQRYAGAQQTAYPAVVAPGATFSERMRLCPGCFRAVVKHPAWELVGQPDELPAPPCGLCGRPETRTALFCTYYERGEERQDLYGRLCENGCLPKFLDAIWGTQEAWQMALRV